MTMGIMEFAEREARAPQVRNSKKIPQSLVHMAAVADAARQLTKKQNDPFASVEEQWEAEVAYWQAFYAYTHRVPALDPTPWLYALLGGIQSMAMARVGAREAEQVTGGFIFLPRPWFEQDKRRYEGKQSLDPEPMVWRVPGELHPEVFFDGTRLAIGVGIKTKGRPHFEPREQFEQDFTEYGLVKDEKPWFCLAHKAKQASPINAQNTCRIIFKPEQGTIQNPEHYRQ